MRIARISLLVGLASLGGPAAAVAAPKPAERGAPSPFASRIAAGPVSISCDGSGPRAGRVRVAAQVAYSDLAGQRRSLRGSRHRGSAKVLLATGGDRTLAREDETEALDRRFARGHVHNTHGFVLSRSAGRRVLRYAHGKERCGSNPAGDRVVEVKIEARQRLEPRGAGARGAATHNRSASLRARAQVVPDARDPASKCPPYACYEEAEDVLDWKPSFVRSFDVAGVPLAGRVASPGPRMLIGFDDGPWAYWFGSDLNAQGSGNGNVYNFSHWRYVDTFYYYAHHLLSVPPTVWVNAAHRNGVEVLAVITSDCDDCGKEMNELFERGGRRLASQLYEMAATYGFDGWVIDVEGEARRSDAVLDVMRDLSRRTLPNGRRVEVAYYEAGEYQLNAELYEALLAAGSWQADYDPNYHHPGPPFTFDFLFSQAPPATDRRFDTYWASYVYNYEQKPPGDCGMQSSDRYLWNGTRCNNIGALFDDQRRAVATADPPGYYQSLSLFAPAWTMFGGLAGTTDRLPPRDDFQTVDERLWSGVGGYRESAGECRLAAPSQNSVSSLISPRSVLTSVPFDTRFNAGEGSRFFIEGIGAGAGEWNLLAAQDPLPTPCGEGGWLQARIDYGDAYDGGSSLLVTGTADQGSRRLYLYEAGAPLSPTTAFVLRHKTTAGPAPHVVVWVDGQGPIDLEPSETRTEGGWTYTRSTLPASVSPSTLTRLGIGFEADGPTEVRARIGELGVVDLASYERPGLIEASITGDGLGWTDPSPSTTRYYNVWAVDPDADCLDLAGRSQLPRYDLVHPLFGLPSDADGFVIQPVTTSGLAAELPEPPC